MLFESMKNKNLECEVCDDELAEEGYSIIILKCIRI